MNGRDRRVAVMVRVGLIRCEGFAFVFHRDSFLDGSCTVASSVSAVRSGR